MNIFLFALIAVWTPEIVHPVKDAATHQMLQAIAAEPDRVVRAAALEAFALIKDPSDAPWVRPRFDDPIPAIRLEARLTAAALALPMPDRPAPRPVPPPWISPAAAQLTAKVAHLENLTTEDAAATTEILAQLRASAVVVQEEAVCAAERDNIVAAVPRLLPLLNDEDEALRQTTCAALAVLGPKGDHQAVDAALATRLAVEPSFLVAHALGDALVAIHDDQARQALEQLLGHSRPLVRAAAATALGQWRAPQVAPVLYPLLNDPEPPVALAAIAALGQLDNRAAAAFFLQRLPRGPSVVQEAVIWWLGEWRVAEAVGPLLDLLQPKATASRMPRIENPTLMAAIAQAMGKIGDPQVIPPLRRVLADNRMLLAEPRRRTIEALRLLQDRESMRRVFELVTAMVIIPPLPGPLCHDSNEVRAEGLRYLASFGDAALGERLFQELKYAVPVDLRPLLATTLHTLTGKAYRPVPNESHRQYCVESLGPQPYHSAPEAPGVALIEKPATP